LWALNPGSEILESNPNNESSHKALFRCRSNEIGKVLGIDFKKVTVSKSIWLDEKEVNPSPRIAHLYSKKVLGTITGRSILNIDQVERYIPPHDFIDQLKSRCRIAYNYMFDANDNVEKNLPIISQYQCKICLKYLSTNTI
jgi:hypothetical protein